MEPLSLSASGQPLYYRVGEKLFAYVTDAECWKMEHVSRLSIEFRYKKRWHRVGGKPQVSRIALPRG